MDDITPPKRVTRSKATAKTNTTQPDLKIATAAVKANATRTAVTTAAKRKARIEDVEHPASKDSLNTMLLKENVVVPKATRGRKKAMETAFGDELAVNEVLHMPPPPPVKSTRGRPKKGSEEAPPVELAKATRGRARRGEARGEAQEEALTNETDTVGLTRSIRSRSRKVDEPLVEEVQRTVPTKSARGRPKKLDVVGEPQGEEVASNASSRSTRGRQKRAVVAERNLAEDISDPLISNNGRVAATLRAVNVSKKCVKFEEPQGQDKENHVPEIIVKSKEAENGTGLKAKPVRKPAVSTRAVRGRTKIGINEDKAPLTPKKATQIATGKENLSEDELATTEKTPMKILTRSPLKAPGSVFGSAKNLEFTTSLVGNHAITQDFAGSLMGSPARRPPPSPYRDSFKTSPKRSNLGDSMSRSPFKPSIQPPKDVTSPFKTSLLQSPARRPQSPAKIANLGSHGRSQPPIRATPKFTVPRSGTTPKTGTKSFNPPRRSLFGSPSKNESEQMQSIDTNLNATSIKPFPGRLSSILPRDVDPIMQGISASMDTTAKNGIIQEEEASLRLVDDIAMIVETQPSEIDMIVEDVRSTTPPNSPPRHSTDNFTLQDEDPFQDSESEDELASGSPKYSPAPLKIFNISCKDFAIPASPTPAHLVHKAPNTKAAHRSDVEHNYGVSCGHSIETQNDQEIPIPISNQRVDWISTESSTLSTEENNRMPKNSGFDQVDTNIQTIIKSSPAKSTFFEDAMTTGNFVGGPEIDILEDLQTESSNEIDALAFAPQILDDEDLALAAEADEMSLIMISDAEDVGESINLLDESVHGDSRAVSEASQEYGDENAAPANVNFVPIDPALIALDAQNQTSTSTIVNAPQISTPVRVLGENERWFHTVSKVPLKPAALDSPLKVNKRSASASRMQAQRQAPLPPSFHTPKLPPFTQDLVLTHGRSNNWSTTGTPIRSPRRSLNDQVLKGAVVFVDVHTTEGADASAVFIDLLGQMGAKCLKTWSWNPNSASSPETTGEEQDLPGTAGKIGITHVVFKDGSKRTLEKVKESKGVVLCVGVGWVLDCERQQMWLSEAPYTVDTGLVPRGGHRRRKSMEPRSIQNFNGTLSLLPGLGATPRSVSAGYSSSPTKESLNLPGTPGTSSRSARRKSTLWVLSPSSDSDTNDETATGLMLSPVPATPAPEAISAYAEHVLDNATPDGGTTPYFLHREELVQRTCPPKTGLGNVAMEGVQVGGTNGEPADDLTGSGVLMQRLLLARRKSLQWAPKVGSPLAKGGFGA